MMFAQKEEGGERNKGHIQKGSSLCTTCEMQKPKIYSYLALHDGAIKKIRAWARFWWATNYKHRAESRARFWRAQTDDVKGTPPKNAVYATLSDSRAPSHGEHPAASQAQWKIVREAVPQPCRDLWFTGKLIVARVEGWGEPLITSEARPHHHGPTNLEIPSGRQTNCAHHTCTPWRRRYCESSSLGCFLGRCENFVFWQYWL